MANNNLVVILFIVLIGSGSLLLLKFLGSPIAKVSVFPNLSSISLPSSDYSLKKPQGTPAVPEFNTTKPKVTASPSQTKAPQPTLKATYKPTPKATVAPTAKAYVPQEERQCHYFTVLHLDGSSSRLCYSQSDYNQLQNLSYQLSSANTFYKFHIDGANEYQRQYEKTGSSIYLDAKSSSEQKAQEEKDKIGNISVQMYNIEQRGH